MLSMNIFLILQAVGLNIYDLIEKDCMWNKARHNPFHIIKDFHCTFKTPHLLQEPFVNQEHCFKALSYKNATRQRTHTMNTIGE